MKESDYINATNLAKLRIAIHVLKDVHPTSDAMKAFLGDAVNRAWSFVHEAEAAVEDGDEV